MRPAAIRVARERRERRARQRRRLAQSLAVLVGLAVGTAVVTDIADAHHHHDELISTSAAASGKTTLVVQKLKSNPLHSAALLRYIHGRSGQVSVAVDDLATGQEWILNPGARDQTASIVKVDILETLLHQHDSSASALRSAETSTALGMIEASDNTDASALWDEVGGASGVAAYNRLAGLTQTAPAGGGYWGETLTSAADQIKLLRQLAQPSKLLTPAARRYQLYLMRDIDSGEGWGVTGGVPDSVSVALKNGWVPLDSYSDWEINSIGWIDGDSRDYLLAVLTANDPDESYGIATIDHIAASVFQTLKITGRRVGGGGTTTTTTTLPTTATTPTATTSTATTSTTTTATDTGATTTAATTTTSSTGSTTTTSG